MADKGAKLFGLLTAECYDKIIVNHTLDISCLKLVVSKLLGYGVIAGSMGYKIPQISAITRGRSAKGLSLVMFVLELIGFAIVLAYNFRHGYSFNTYGENFFMILQNVIIVFLIGYYEHLFGAKFFCLSAAYFMGFYCLVSNLVSMELLSVLMSATIPLFALSRIPQIYSNFKNKSTGALSFLTCFMQVGGTAARIFTTLQEVNDSTVLLGFLTSFALNLIMLLQIVIYRKPSRKQA